MPKQSKTATSEPSETKQLRRSARVKATEDVLQSAKIEVEEEPVRQTKKAKVLTTITNDTAKNSSDANADELRVSDELKIGDEIPDVKIEDQDGNLVALRQVASKGPIVIFAYPKASTPGCTRQACGFRDSYVKFEALGAAVYGLSADSESAQKIFKEKQKLPYTLLADSKYKLVGPLGAKKTSAGGVTRSYWIFKDGKLAVKAIGVKPEESVQKALADLQT